MFGFRRKHRPRAAVSHSYEYIAKFSCTHPGDYREIRKALAELTGRCDLISCSDSTWHGHVLTVEFTLMLPWAGPAAQAVVTADAAMTYLIRSTPIAGRIQRVERRGEGRVHAADWAQVAAHPDLAQLEEHCAVYYGDTDGD